MNDQKGSPEKNDRRDKKTQPEPAGSQQAEQPVKPVPIDRRQAERDLPLDPDPDDPASP